VAGGRPHQQQPLPVDPEGRSSPPWPPRRTAPRECSQIANAFPTGGMRHAASRRTVGVAEGTKGRHDRSKMTTHPGHLSGESGPANDLEIRGESPDDRGAISQVVAAAFGSDAEPRLVEAIRASPSFVGELSLVALLDHRIVGHVMVSIATLRHGDAVHRIANLSPLAVTPDAQRRGIGSALVRSVTSRANDLGEPLVVLEGSPAFYRRLGFEYSVPYGIYMTLPSWAPPQASQVIRLDNYQPHLRGRVEYPSAFDHVADH
jgi:putative acetyltransferase